MAENFVAVDPGQHTGWCLCVWSGGHGYEIVKLGEFEWKWGSGGGGGAHIAGTDPEQRLVRQVEQWLEEIEKFCGVRNVAWPRLWVVEDFILRPVVGSTKREGLSPVRVTTALIACLGSFSGGDIAVVRQQPVDIAQFCGRLGNERLKKRGLWVSGSEHVRDAVRHALQFTRKHEFDLELRLD